MFRQWLYLRRQHDHKQDEVESTMQRRASHDRPTTPRRKARKPRQARIAGMLWRAEMSRLIWNCCGYGMDEQATRQLITWLTKALAWQRQQGRK